MNNPYDALPDTSFWSKTVAHRDCRAIDPVTDVPFQISRHDKVATAGSCFAQHISKSLVKRGYSYLITEQKPATGGENYGVFPARFGNLYTVRQLLQTFERAYSLFRPVNKIWTRPDGAFVDPFRPRIESRGFATLEELEQDRKSHLAAVRVMFESCDVFIFTLGLSEGWVSKQDGAVFPLAPGVAGGEMTDEYAFHNFRVGDMVTDLSLFIARLRSVNPNVRIILTVSPVPLIATYEPRHVLVSNTYSKAALRVVADEVIRANPNICYFPSYEIVTSSHGAFYESDRRNVTSEGVDHVMSLFSYHFLSERACSRPEQPGTHNSAAPISDDDRSRFERLAEIVCDEEAIDHT